MRRGTRKAQRGGQYFRCLRAHETSGWSLSCSINLSAHAGGEVTIPPRLIGVKYCSDEAQTLASRELDWWAAAGKSYILRWTSTFSVWRI